MKGARNDKLINAAVKKLKYDLDILSIYSGQSYFCVVSLKRQL